MNYSPPGCVGPRPCVVTAEQVVEVPAEPVQAWTAEQQPALRSLSDVNAVTLPTEAPSLS